MKWIKNFIAKHSVVYLSYDREREERVLFGKYRKTPDWYRNELIEAIKKMEDKQ